MVRAPTTVPNKKQRVLRTLMLACVVLAVGGAAVVGSASYPSLASSTAALVNPTTPLEGTSYPVFDDTDDEGIDNQPAAAWGLILVVGALLGRLLWPLYREPNKLRSIFNSSLERPG